jgi:hypothetical protein
LGDDFNKTRPARQRQLNQKQDEKLLILPEQTQPYPFLIPDGGYVGLLGKKLEGTASVLGESIPYRFSGLNQIRYKFPIFTKEILEKADDPEDTLLEKQITENLIDTSASFSKILHPPADLTGIRGKIETRINKQNGAKGAIISAVGSAFEAAITSALNIEQVLSEGDADFDVPDTYAGEGKNVLSNLFGLGEANTWKAAEFKATGSEGNINSYVSKVIKTLGLYKNKQETPTETPKTPKHQNQNQNQNQKKHLVSSPTLPLLTTLSPEKWRQEFQEIKYMLIKMSSLKSSLSTEKDIMVANTDRRTKWRNARNKKSKKGR